MCTKTHFIVFKQFHHRSYLTTSSSTPPLSALFSIHFIHFLCIAWVLTVTAFWCFSANGNERKSFCVHFDHRCRRRWRIWRLSVVAVVVLIFVVAVVVVAIVVRMSLFSPHLLNPTRCVWRTWYSPSTHRFVCVFRIKPHTFRAYRDFRLNHVQCGEQMRCKNR